MICTCMRMCMNASPQRPAAAFAVVYDLDGVVGAEGRGADAALLARSVHHCLRLRQPWAMCGANGQDAVGRYYDMWALRTTDEWMHAARASNAAPGRPRTPITAERCRGLGATGGLGCSRPLGGRPSRASMGCSPR